MFTVRVSQGFDVLDSFGVVLGEEAHRPAGLLPLKATADPAAMRHSRAVLAAGAVVRQLPSWLRDIVGEVRAVQTTRVILVLARRHHGRLGRSDQGGREGEGDGDLASHQLAVLRRE